MNGEINSATRNYFTKTYNSTRCSQVIFSSKIRTCSFNEIVKKEEKPFSKNINKFSLRNVRKIKENKSDQCKKFKTRRRKKGINLRLFSANTANVDISS